MSCVKSNCKFCVALAHTRWWHCNNMDFQQHKSNIERNGTKSFFNSAPEHFSVPTDSVPIGCSITEFLKIYSLIKVSVSNRTFKEVRPHRE